MADTKTKTDDAEQSTVPPSDAMVEESGQTPDAPAETADAKPSAPPVPKAPPVSPEIKRSAPGKKENKVTEIDTPEPITLRVVHDFSAAFNGGVQRFKKDQIVSDPLIVKFLIENKCAVISVTEKVDFQVCPNCTHRF